MKKVELLINASTRSRLPGRGRRSILDEQEAQLLAEIRQAVAHVQTQEQALAGRRAGDVVVVVSDITRPVPYARFLPRLLARLESETRFINLSVHNPCPADAGTHRMVDHDVVPPSCPETCLT